MKNTTKKEGIAATPERTATQTPHATLSKVCAPDAGTPANAKNTPHPNPVKTLVSTPTVETRPKDSLGSPEKYAPALTRMPITNATINDQMRSSIEKSDFEVRSHWVNRETPDFPNFRTATTRMNHRHRT